MKKNPNAPDQPVSGLTGWGAAQKILDRCKDDERRLVLIQLARQAGLQSAPALEYLTRRLRYHADGGDCPVPSLKLAAAEVRFIETRGRELLVPWESDRRFTHMRFLHPQEAQAA
jgi:hypothetical protein